jgi:RNA polymerase sigma-70 factor (ECF subfamily)
MVEKDKEILNRLGKDDQLALRELFEQYNKPLFYYACKFVNADEAHDIIQDVFVYLWQQRSMLVVSSSLNGYLSGMVRNSCLKHLRNVASKTVDMDDERHLKLEELKHFQQDPDAINSLIEKELEGKLQEALEKLPPRCLEVFLLSRKEGLKNKEIANQLGISEKSVEKHITKALQIVRMEFKDYLTVFSLLYGLLVK